MRVLGVVLAGGRGVRMGEGPVKALRQIEGRTLLDRALSTAGAACDEVVVSAAAGVRLDPGEVAGAIVVCDAEGTAGPLAGVVAASAGRSFGAAIVLGVDFPLVRPETLKALLARLDIAMAQDAHATVPRPSGVPQPLCAAYSAAGAAALAAAFEDGERSIVSALRRLKVAWIDDDDIAGLPAGEAALTNVNTLEDLERAAAWLRRDAMSEERR